MGNACCQDSRTESIRDQEQMPSSPLGKSQNQQERLKKMSAMRVEANSLPLTNNRIEQHIKKLSKFPPTENKMWKLKQPYNMIYVNRETKDQDQLPKGYVKVYKLKDNGQFNGYYEGKITKDFQPDLSEGFFVYHNASCLVGTGPNQGAYTNETTNLSYEGGWVNQQPHGYGKEHNNKGTYVGDYFEGQKHGSGKFEWTDGASYEGNLEHGAFHGKGTFKQPGAKYSYIGQYCQDYKHGEGKEEKATQTYEGQFFKGKRCGKGTLTVYDDQDKSVPKYTYEGTFQDNKPHGLGCYTNVSNGHKLHGIWQHDVLLAVQ